MVFILLVILLSTDRWAEKDINPALFSRELMRNSSNFLKDEEVYLVKPQHYLHTPFPLFYAPVTYLRHMEVPGQLWSSNSSHESSCCNFVYWICNSVSNVSKVLYVTALQVTICSEWYLKRCTIHFNGNRIIAMLEKTGTLKIASVGDCGLKVIRKGKLVKQYMSYLHFLPILTSDSYLFFNDILGQIMFSIYPQEHYFDCPYQISSEAVGQTYQDALVSTFFYWLIFIYYV